MDQRVPRRLLGLALGGGNELGMAHLGVLHVLDRNGIKPSFISGCSAGALAAAFYAAGVPVERMKEIGLRLNWRKLQKWVVPILALTSNKPLAEFLRHMLPAGGFGALEIPLRVVTTDLLTAEMVVFEGGPEFKRRGMVQNPEIVFVSGADLAEAVRASCTRPVVNRPVQIGNRLLVDGGLASNVPALLTRDMGADVVIGVDLHARRWKDVPPANMLAYAVQAQAISLHWGIKGHHIAADVIIRPDFSAVPRMDFSAAAALIECGEKAALDAIPAIQRALHQVETGAMYHN